MDNSTKKCRECGNEKPLSEFYLHKMMSDGTLNKCKACVKDRVKKHRETNLESVRAYDRERGRTEERLALNRKRAKENSQKYAHAKKAWQKRNPEKRAAHIKVGNAVRDGKLIKQPCEVCGEKKTHAHHDDYSKPLAVRWLCLIHHAVTWRTYQDPDQDHAGQ